MATARTTPARIAAFASCAIVVALAAILPAHAYADDTAASPLLTAQATTAVVVTDAAGRQLNSYGIIDSDITTQLADALAYGKSLASCDQTTVTVPAGSYTIDANRWIRIFSNTKLVMDGATIKQTATDSGQLQRVKNNTLMVQGCHFGSSGQVCTDSSCTHGKQTQVQNVTVEGGVWDANCKSNPTWNVSCILIQHGKNVTFKNVAFKNFTNHAVNVAGTQNVQVVGCTFSNAVKFTGDSERFWGGKVRTAQGKIDRIRSTEAVHTDFCNKEGEKTAYPLDNSACKNILVTGCTFTDTYSGVGTHHENASATIDGLTVEKCTFTLKDGNAVNLFSTTNAKVLNNKVTGGYCLVRANDSKGVVANNKTNKCTGNAIGSVNASKLTVKNNTIKKTTGAGILFSDKASGTISGNKIVNSSKGTGVNISGGKATVKNNTISGGAIGIAFKSASGASSAIGNVVAGASTNGIYVVSTTKGKITFSKNTVKGSKGAGIRIDKSKNVTASKNVVRNNRFGFSVSASKNLGISKNKASGGEVIIRVVQKSTGVKVTNNTLKAQTGRLCSSNAIYFYGRCTGTVSGNTIVKAGTAGVRVDGKCEIAIKGNKITAPGTKALSIS